MFTAAGSIWRRPAGAGTGTDNAALPLQGYGVFFGKRFAACHFPVFFANIGRLDLGPESFSTTEAFFSESVRQKRVWQDNGNKKEHTVN